MVITKCYVETGDGLHRTAITATAVPVVGHDVVLLVFGWRLVLLTQMHVFHQETTWI